MENLFAGVPFMVWRKNFKYRRHLQWLWKNIKFFYLWKNLLPITPDRVHCMKNIDTGKAKFLWKSEKVDKFVRFISKCLDFVHDKKLIWFLQIRSQENILHLNGKNVLYPKIVNMVWKFIQADQKNYNQLINNLCKFKDIFQYVYANVHPEPESSTERTGFDFKHTFQLVFKI